MEASKVSGAIIAAAVVPFVYALAFLYGFAFRLSFFSAVGIPLEWLGVAYWENAGVASPLLFEVVRAILYGAVWFFLVRFLLGLVVKFCPNCFREKARTITKCISLLAGFVAFYVEACRSNHAPRGEFICWMVLFGALVVGAAWWLKEESAEMKVLFFTTIILLYFGWYGVDQAVYFGKVAAHNNTRRTLTVDSREYVYYGNFGEFFILGETAEPKAEEAQYLLVPFPSKDAQIGRYIFQTKKALKKES